jgi:asparagine synthase (glutamine-hydrolysing)
MCGLAAIFAYDSSAAPIDESELIRIRDYMLRRGPDAEGLWLSPDRRVGLAHRRLSILDLSEAGNQPMADSSGQVIIVYNGEIYNFAELRQALAVRGYRFRSSSDTEVLLALWLEHGPEMLRQLRGMYAFVIWDNRTKTLFAARDPFGIKPLYYSARGGTLRIASQARGLTAGGKIDDRPDSAGHVGFFLWGHIPDPWTLYKGVRALEAGTTLTCRLGGLPQVRRFFDVGDFIAACRERKRPVCREDLRAVLLDSVRRHLIADVPVGVFLSSGIDSATVAALASECHGRVMTVTLGFDEYRGTAADETLLAAGVAQRYGLRHEVVWLSRSDANFSEILAAMDQPSIDGVNTYLVSRAAVSAGLKVALSGLGGDEVFGGYNTFRRVPLIAAVMGRLGVARHVLPALSCFAPGRQRDKFRSLAHEDRSWARVYLVLRCLFPPDRLGVLFDGEFLEAGLEELTTEKRLDASRASLEEAHWSVAAFELQWYMRHQLLRDTDWASMAHLLEVRVPLVDLRVLEVVACSEQPLGKRDLALTPHPPLPDEVLRRPKLGFSVPVPQWLDGEVADACGLDSLKPWALKVYSYFCGSDGRRKLARLLPFGANGERRGRAVV